MDGLSLGADRGRHLELPPGTVVVSLPAEMEYTNSEEVAEKLAAAITPGVTILIADGTQTVFCDSSAMAQLVHARGLAAASGITFRVVVAHHRLRDRLFRTGLDSYLAIYPTLAEALQRSG